MADMVERPVPYDLGAEEAVLGSLLLDRDAVIKIAPFLRPEDFYREAHGWIYGAVLDLYARREPPDPVTLSSELERSGKLENIGGYSYLVKLVNNTPTAVHIEYYAHIVERTSVLRRLISAGGEIAALGYSEDKETTDVLDKAEQILFSISQRTATKDFASIEQVLNEYYDRIESIQHSPGSVVGVSTGFHDLDEVTGGLQKSDLIIMAARPGVGKCLPGHTLIDDPVTGRRMTLKEYFERQLPSVMGLSERGQVRATAISDWIDSGVQPTYRVTTRLGRQVEVTGHHPFLTVNGWVPLHDLKVGDRIAVPRSLPVFGDDDSVSPERARILAYLIAEGCLTSHSPQFTNADPEIVQDLTRCISQEFPVCSVLLQVGSSIDYRITRPYKPGSQRHVPNPLTVWLKEIGLWGKSAHNKSFPDFVWQLSAPRLADFLKTLMSCDGSIYPDEKGNPRIEFSVASEKLAADVYHAFVRFGIVGRYYKKKAKCWRVQVTEGESVRRYQEIIGWIGEKAGRFPEMRLRSVAELNGNIGHVPQPAWELVRSARREAGLSMIELARRAGETSGYGKYAGYNAHTNRSIPRNRLTAYGDVLDNKTLRLLGSSDLFWDAIVAIEYSGEQQVYDLTVPDGSNFIAEDICVLNTRLSLGIAHNAAERGSRVGVFSLELCREQLVQRLLAVETGVDSQRLRLGYLNDEEWQNVSDAIGRLAQMPIFIDDSAGLTIHEIRSKSRRLEAESGVDLLIVDYLQLMQGTSRRDGNRVQEVSEISRGLKVLARELNIPVVACAQLSRAVESRTNHVPMLSDLRESGSIEQDADIVMFIHREEMYNPETEKKGIAEIHIAKHRNGPLTTIPLRFFNRTTKFADLEVYRQEE
jgi:replicative DNA helicase